MYFVVFQLYIVFQYKGLVCIIIVKDMLAFLYIVNNIDANILFHLQSNVFKVALRRQHRIKVYVKGTVVWALQKESLVCYWFWQSAS